MKKFLPILILLFVFASCKKEEYFSTTKEDPSITPPALNIKVSKTGNERIITIRGAFDDLQLTQSFHSLDGSVDVSKPTIDLMYRLNYDTLTLISVGGGLPHQFKRTAPYTYTYTHTINSAERETNWVAVYYYGADKVKEFNLKY